LSGVSSPRQKTGVGRSVTPASAISSAMSVASSKKAHERGGVGPLVDHEDLATGLVGEELVVDAPGVSGTLGDPPQPFGIAVESFLYSRWIGRDPQRHDYDISSPLV
jgi:hypothetical protein